MCEFLVNVIQYNLQSPSFNAAYSILQLNGNIAKTIGLLNELLFQNDLRRERSFVFLGLRHEMKPVNT